MKLSLTCPEFARALTSLEASTGGVSDGLDPPIVIIAGGGACCGTGVIF